MPAVWRLTYIDEYGQMQTTTVISVIPDNEDSNENILDSHFSICEANVLNSDVFINITTDGKIFYYLQDVLIIKKTYKIYNNFYLQKMYVQN